MPIVEAIPLEPVEADAIKIKEITLEEEVAPVEIHDKIQAALGIAADIKDGTAIVNGRVLRKVGAVVKAYIPPTTPFGVEVEDDAFDATTKNKVLDIIDGTTNYLTQAEQDALAEAIATEAFNYRDLFNLMWKYGLVQEYIMRMMKQSYTANPAYLTTWHNRVLAAGIPDLFQQVT
mgnify:CR=1 FL=1